MGVRTDDARVHERGTLSLPGVIDGALHGVVAGEQIAPVHFFDEEVRKRANKPGDTAAGCVHFDRNRDGVTVVLYQIDDGQLEVRRGVQGLPELAFTRRALAGGDQDDLVFLESLRDV